ncbi:flagellar hook-length control protein FliK [Bacillus sp. SORGH_AS 510]|uniref:flagellar hook-length control protein FliK n=1 Tax=Bacillus sp. SORGH_AS_0510 TaxID=3041771 RepID=UPI0027811DC9|nr:flagellar hook-length control protein FliK [Bacillus sp. SORGH_AS_0510]MDQ1146320.1 flagellar hook-length control protein FliK [Bacillus sp. SORGH_AS_0510]
MGITQINIKINQTNQVNGGKPNLASNSEATVNPFDQVLAMFNLLGQTPMIGDQVNKLSLHNGAIQMGDIPTQFLKIKQVTGEANSEPMNTDSVQSESDLEEHNYGDRDPVDLNLNVDNVMYNLPMLRPNAGLNNSLNQDDNQSSLKVINALETKKPSFNLDEPQFSRQQIHLTNKTDLVKTNEDDILPDSMELINKNLDEIESILTNLVNEFSTQESTSFSIGNNPSEGGTHTSVGENNSNPLSSSSPEIAKVLAQVQDLVETMKKFSPKDSGQLLHKVTQVIEEVRKYEGEKNPSEIPAHIDEKIQIISNEIKAAQKSVPILVLNNHDQTTSDTKQNELSNISQGLSLDKNQVIHSVLPNVGKSFQLHNRLTKDPLSSPLDEISKVNGQLTSLTNTQQMSGNEVKESNLQQHTEVTNFAPEVSEWINRFMKITNGKSGSTEAKFSLYPEHLGHIEIKVTSQQGQISAQILTDTPMAKDALEGQLHHLKQALQQSGLNVQKLDVAQQTSNTSDSFQGGMAFSQDGSHSSREQRTYTAATINEKVQNETNEQKDREGEIVPINYGGTTLKTSSQIDFTA